MAEFVTRTIDNSSHGLTVQAAMDNLKLKEYASHVSRAVHTHLPVGAHHP